VGRVYEGGEYREFQFPLLIEPMGDWTQRSLCAEKVRAGKAHPDDWFPRRGSDINVIRRALAICDECPVIEPCREWAVKHNEYGIWGGWTSKRLRQVHYETSRQCKQCMSYFAVANELVGQRARPSFCSETCRLERKRAINLRSRERRRIEGRE